SSSGHRRVYHGHCARAIPARPNEPARPFVGRPRGLADRLRRGIVRLAAIAAEGRMARLAMVCAARHGKHGARCPGRPSDGYRSEVNTTKLVTSAMIVASCLRNQEGAKGESAHPCRNGTAVPPHTRSILTQVL